MMKIVEPFLYFHIEPSLLYSHWVSCPWRPLIDANRHREDPSGVMPAYGSYLPLRVCIASNGKAPASFGNISALSPMRSSGVA